MISSFILYTSSNDYDAIQIQDSKSYKKYTALAIGASVVTLGTIWHSKNKKILEPNPLPIKQPEKKEERVTELSFNNFKEKQVSLKIDQNAGDSTLECEPFDINETYEIREKIQTTVLETWKEILQGRDGSYIQRPHPTLQEAPQDSGTVAVWENTNLMVESSKIATIDADGSLDIAIGKQMEPYQLLRRERVSKKALKVTLVDWLYDEKKESIKTSLYFFKRENIILLVINIKSLFTPNSEKQKMIQNGKNEPNVERIILGIVGLSLVGYGAVRYLKKNKSITNIHKPMIGMDNALQPVIENIEEVDVSFDMKKERRELQEQMEALGMPQTMHEILSEDSVVEQRAPVKEIQENNKENEIASRKPIQKRQLTATERAQSIDLRDLTRTGLKNILSEPGLKYSSYNPQKHGDFQNYFQKFIRLKKIPALQNLVSNMKTKLWKEEESFWGSKWVAFQPTIDDWVVSGSVKRSQVCLFGLSPTKTIPGYNHAWLSISDQKGIIELKCFEKGFKQSGDTNPLSKYKDQQGDIILILERFTENGYKI